ncbi:hypothetical protein ARMSODRAFT_950447 [Armillaria solidipes]|uniref:Uncharacterized protein n=1 Tax=Armillaria solidipes TaxID=1076256 RepID=A0A2H3C2G8_9AGAR|nr:hypothetical protein ARMSODRAFT_950447 [Armillaria solidipes]
MPHLWFTRYHITSSIILPSALTEGPRLSHPGSVQSSRRPIIHELHVYFKLRRPCDFGTRNRLQGFDRQLRVQGQQHLSLSSHLDSSGFELTRMNPSQLTVLRSDIRQSHSQNHAPLS